MRLLIGYMLCSFASSAQNTPGFGDSSIVKTVDLPAREPFDTSRTWQKTNRPYVYIISDRDLYYNFDYATVMRFYGFNFADYHILGERKNNNEWVWLMRENEKALSEITVSTSPGWADPFTNGRHPFFEDTLVKPVSGAGMAKWYTTGRGDCMASFKYKIYSDRYHPVLLLKEWNYWGGCRAGGTKIYTVSFQCLQALHIL